MPRYAPNKMPTALKRRYFELIRTGLSGSAAAQEVGVSLSCGSLWFIDAGRVSFIETAISSRYLSQDDRIEIADGLAQGEPVKLVAARIGKTYQSVYREIARNRKPDWVCQSDLAPLGGLVLARCGPTLDQSFPFTFGSSARAIRRGEGLEGEIESGAV
jgi:hypothetical protein